MKLTRTTRMAAGFAAATIATALALPGLAMAAPHHDPKPHDPHVVNPPKLCLFLDEAGNAHPRDWPGWGKHGPSLHGAIPCSDEAPVQAAPVEEAPMQETTSKSTVSYPTQSKTGSVATESSDAGIAIVTLAAAAALGGVAVRRATR